MDLTDLTGLYGDLSGPAGDLAEAFGDLSGGGGATGAATPDHSGQVLQELQRLNGNLESWFQVQVGPTPTFNGVTVDIMLGLFFAAFAGGFVLTSVSRLVAYLVKKINELFGKA